MPTAPWTPVPPISVTRRLDVRDVVTVRELVDQATTRHGYSPIDAGRLQLALDGDVAGYVGALAWDTGGARLAGYAQAVRGEGAWNMDVVVARSSSATDRSDLAAALVEAVRREAAGEDDAAQRLWAFHADAASDRLAARLGLSASREIRQLRCALPLDPRVRGRADPPGDELQTRAFVVGQDEAAWLDVNHRAFEWHPEQGAVTMADLQAREKEAWFDPEGFRLHARAGALAGFCWTKIHADAEPPLGEIYVIGVDPSAQGEGLGRGLVVAGLDHLTRAGITTGMLYVEATNDAALRLYANLGFTPHHVDRVYS